MTFHPEEEDLDPKEMLQVLAEEVELNEALVVGWTKDENLFVATSHGKAADMLFVMELAKTVLLNRCLPDD